VEPGKELDRSGVSIRGSRLELLDGTRRLRLATGAGQQGAGQQVPRRREPERRRSPEQRPGAAGVGLDTAGSALQQSGSELVLGERIADRGRPFQPGDRRRAVPLASSVEEQSCERHLRGRVAALGGGPERLDRRRCVGLIPPAPDAVHPADIVQRPEITGCGRG
jgi:hypothetical protein